MQGPAGALVYANESGARLTGFDSAEELLRTPVEEVVSRFALFDEENRPVAVDELPGRRPLRGEYRPKADPGAQPDVGRGSLVGGPALPVLNDAGEVIYAVNLFRDVTRLFEQAKERRRRPEHRGVPAEARAHHAVGAHSRLR